MINSKLGEAVMEACASVSGGVMFVSEQVERKREPFSYTDFAEMERNKERERVLTLRQPEEDAEQREAA